MKPPLAWPDGQGHGREKSGSAPPLYLSGGASCYPGIMTVVYASQPDPNSKPAYPFAEWLNGSQWVLTRGRDYWGDPAQMIRSLEASARARRVKVTIALDERTRAIYVRATLTRGPSE